MTIHSSKPWLLTLALLLGCGGRGSGMTRLNGGADTERAPGNIGPRVEEPRPLMGSERRHERREATSESRVEDRTGWSKLGERVVDGKADRDTIAVGRGDGRFSKVMLVVEHASLEMLELEFTFADGSTYAPHTRLVFDQNSASRVIDLPGKQRVIAKAVFKYGSMPGGGRAQVELWAK